MKLGNILVVDLSTERTRGRSISPLRASVENAASYSPHDIATPMASQLTINAIGPVAKPSDVNAAAKSRFEAGSTRCPPCRSISRPKSGPQNPAMSSPQEKAINTQGVVTPRSTAMRFARIAGRE
jgi:hypothetical protein